MKNKRIFIITALGLFIVSGIAGYYGPPWLAAYRFEKAREAFTPPGMPKLVVDNFSRQFNSLDAATEPKRLPDGTFFTIEGKPVTIAGFAGKPTLINFWATWCTPCVVELPSLQKFRDHYDGRLNVVGIALEEGKTPAQIKTFLEGRELGDFAGYVDQKGELARNLDLRGIPTSYLLGSDGQILYRFEGDADWTGDDSQKFFDIFLLQNR